MIEFSCDEWRSGPVEVATTFRQRLIGLIRNPGHGLLIRSRSVHTVGMHDVIGLVGLGRSGLVVRTATVRPWRVVQWPAVTWILEVPTERDLPPPGSRLTAHQAEPDGTS